jgi:hypothetical protein
VTPKQFVTRRNAYSYPAVGLRTVTTGRTFPSVSIMEKRFARLLHSPVDTQVQFGYLNVIYWGHYLGKAGMAREKFALSKVRRALSALHRKHLTPRHVATKIRRAARLIRIGRVGEALNTLTGLPELGVSFASKVCAFLAPRSCGVADSRIAKNYPAFGFSLGGRYSIAHSQPNHLRYQSYCAFLRRKAVHLNSLGRRFLWRDNRGRKRQWRAVDVERAIYDAQPPDAADRLAAGCACV